jgi:hypothetical protein
VDEAAGRAEPALQGGPAASRWRWAVNPRRRDRAGEVVVGQIHHRVGRHDVGDEGPDTASYFGGSLRPREVLTIMGLRPRELGLAWRAPAYDL